MEIFNSVLLDANETVQAVLGKANAPAVLKGEDSKNGVVILSDKRIYFRGRGRSRGFGGFPSTRLNTSIAVPDVKDFRKAYRNSGWAIVLWGILTIIAIFNVVVLVGGIATWELTAILSSIFSLIVCLIPCVIFYRINSAGTYAMYYIADQRNGYGINLSSVTVDELKIFETELKALIGKDTHQSTRPSNPTPSAPAAPTVDVPAELKKYKELLDAGIITQEEFDAKKAKLLDL